MNDIYIKLKWTVSLSPVTGQGTVSGPWQAVRFLRVVRINIYSALYGAVSAASGAEKSVMATNTFERRFDRYTSFFFNYRSFSLAFSLTDLLNGVS